MTNFDDDGGGERSSQRLLASSAVVVFLAHSLIVLFFVLVLFLFLLKLEACLSAVSAAEGLEVSSSALCALAQFHMGDLRACLLTLQVMVMYGFSMVMIFGTCPHR